jgi:hypothetical protein
VNSATTTSAGAGSLYGAPYSSDMGPTRRDLVRTFILVAAIIGAESVGVWAIFFR